MPERPRGTSAWDRGIVLALVPAVIAEGLWRDGLAHRPLQIAVGLTLLATVWFRRSRPLAAAVIAFGLSAALTVIPSPLGADPLYTSACVLLLPYSLARWGSGRAIAGGLAVMAVAYAAPALRGDVRSVSDAIGGAVVLLFPAVLGAAVRFRARAHRREVEHAKLREREQLARELHDTVAHHVTAIAIQAQAGRAVLASRPEAAAGALEAIAEEATRTLAELRSIVRTLRDDDDPALTPQAGIADIERLARARGDVHGDGPVVEVETVGELDGVRAAVQSTLYRLAQEAITNAVRHARRATRVRVRVASEDDVVRLTVRDDGEPVKARGAGFGLVGMAERAALLGGTLEAGPSADGGWVVEAVVPRDGGR